MSRAYPIFPSHGKRAWVRRKLNLGRTDWDRPQFLAGGFFEYFVTTGNAPEGARKAVRRACNNGSFVATSAFLACCG